MTDTSLSQSYPSASGSRSALAKAIPRRPAVGPWVGLVLAIGFALFVVPTITAERWLAAAGVGQLVVGAPAPLTIRVAPFAGSSHLAGGGVVIARGTPAATTDVETAREVAETTPHGGTLYLAFAVLVIALGAIFTHHMRRSTRGRLLRVQLVSLALIAVLAIVLKLVLLASAISILVVPVALLAMVPTMVLDRIVGLATGVLAALIFSFLGPFDVGVALVLLVQAAVAGLVVAERPKHRMRAALVGGAVATLCTAVTYPLLTYFTLGHAPLAELADPLHSPWVAAAAGPALATLLLVPLLPLYQLLVGEITHHKLIELEDLSNPLLRQIAERAPGTWQHSLMMANMAEIAANAIGANGRLVRVGAYYHDLGKSLAPKYFIENVEPGETSPHDQLPPEVSCDAIFAHVTEGIVAARKAGLHERIVDFMHMHHGNGVLEYFWAKAREQGNPKGFTVENFRYPGFPPQSRETAILTICDAVEAASRTLKKPDAAAIDSLVQRIVYGKLHLGQLDESGLSMSDLRLINDSLRETIRHANHGRIEYPWQKEEAAAKSAAAATPITITGPRLDSLDRPGSTSPKIEPAATQADGAATPSMRPSIRPSNPPPGAPAMTTTQVGLAIADTAEVARLATEKPAEKPPAETPKAQDPKPTEKGIARASEPKVKATATLVDDDAPTPLPEPFPDVPSRVSGPVLTPGEVYPPLTLEKNEALEEELREHVIEIEVLTPPPRAAPTELEPQAPMYLEPARKRAATLSPTPATRAPTVQPIEAARSDAQRLEPAAVQRPIETGARGDAHPTIPRKIPSVPPATEPVTAPRKLPSVPPPTELRKIPSVPPMNEPKLPTVPPPVTLRRSTSKPPSKEQIEARPELGRGERMDNSISRPPERRHPDLDTMRTNPPPLRKSGMASDRGELIDEQRITAERLLAAAKGDPDVATTEPSMPAFEEVKLQLPLQAPPSNPAIQVPDAPTRPSNPRAQPMQPPEVSAAWAAGLAARIDAAIDEDFGGETPVVAPSKAELRSLLGQPDVTRKQSLDEIERLQRAVAARNDAREHETEILQRRSPHPTTEVDPDDIEAVIEVAPHVRRKSNPIAVAKPKKPQ